MGSNEERTDRIHKNLERPKDATIYRFGLDLTVADFDELEESLKRIDEAERKGYRQLLGEQVH